MAANQAYKIKYVKTLFEKEKNTTSINVIPQRFAGRKLFLK